MAHSCIFKFNTNPSFTGLVDVTHPQDGAEEPIDIFAIGFQEIVDLNASNIMAASTDNAKLWAEELQRTISRDHAYVLLTYQQLVGVCLYVFVRPLHAGHIRDVAVDCVKTGMGGATGNKGAAAIRFVLHGTSLCFVAAHFAAGQSQVAERNADYAEITRKIAFPMGRTLKSHDYVFFCGDFNYRIDMDKDELREQVKLGELSAVLEHDQLQQQKEAGNVFNDFIEGEITFPPTYKYDLFSDDYDTSEKCRAPAWTDRVLWRRRKSHPDADRGAIHGWTSGKLVHYGRSELKQSDHRPVIAIIDIEIAQIDGDRRKAVFHDVIKHLGPPDATIVIHADTPCGGEPDVDDGAGIYDEDLMAALIQELAQIGEVTLVRYVGETMWITFRDGESALTAVQKKSVCVCGVTLHFQLKTDNWVAQVEREIDLCTTNTVQLCELSPIGAGASVATGSGDYNSLGIPKVPPQRPKSPPNRPTPPHRPPLPRSPNQSPAPSPKHIPKAGVISVIPDMLGKMRTTPAPISVVAGGGAAYADTHPQQTSSGTSSTMTTPDTPKSNEPPYMTSGGAHQQHESSAIYEEINDDIVSI